MSATPGKIFCGGMPYSMTEPEFTAKFDKFGLITDSMFIFFFSFLFKVVCTKK